MGTGIAESCLLAGYEVILVDPLPGARESGREKVGAFLRRTEEKGRIQAGQAEALLAKLKTGTGLELLAGAELVIQAAPEDQALKQDLFRRLDKVCPPPAVLASNTSSIPIGRLAAATKNPERVLGLHFMNPVPLMPLVELIASKSSSTPALVAARELCARLGKRACECADLPGFVANRLLMPFINEAALLLEQGAATAEDIDAIMKLGARHPMGPLELADFIGLDTCVSILELLQKELKQDRFKPAALLKDLVLKGKLGRKSGEGFYRHG